MSEKNKYYCGCGKSYSRKSGLKRHRTNTGCGVTLSESKPLTMPDLISLLRDKDHRLHEKDEQLKQKDEEIQYLRKELGIMIETSSRPNVNNSIGSINITTNQIKQLLTEYSTGPVLDKITDMTYVFDEEYELFFEDIAYDHRRKILYKTLGDSIVSYYKTPDPKDQAVWNTDSSRLNYLIKHAIGKKKVGWITDKKGHRVTEQIITPVLTYLKKKLNTYAPQTANPKTLQLQGELFQVVKEINDGQLAERINKYIAGHFYMTDHARKAISYKKPKKQGKQ